MTGRNQHKNKPELKQGQFNNNKTMKTNLSQTTTSSILRCTAAALILGAVSVSADTDTATVKIYGKISGRVAIKSSQDKELTETQLLNGVTDLEVTTITEWCNFPHGYTVTMSTENFASGLPFMKGETTTSTVQYDLKYKGQPIRWDSGKALVTDSNDPTPRAGLDKDMTISIPSAQELMADAYSDVLTLTIANK